MEGVAGAPSGLLLIHPCLTPAATPYPDCQAQTLVPTSRPDPGLLNWEWPLSGLSLCSWTAEWVQGPGDGFNIRRA